MIKLRLEILFQLIIFLILLVVYLLVMGGSHVGRFQVSTIYNDSDSSFIWVENQVSLGINETVKVKSIFEQWIWDQDAAKVYQHQGENGIFTTAECQHDFNKK